MPANTIHLCRLLLICALVVITHLATNTTTYPLLEHVSDKVNHSLAFVVLALLLDFSFPRTGFGWLKAGFLLFYGLNLELLQYFLPHRFFSLWDVLADTTGVLIYRMFYPWLEGIKPLDIDKS